METARNSAPLDQRISFAYEMLTLRQLGHDSVAWQTPGLSLTAQAFLLTIALGADSSSLARVISAVIGAGVGLLAMQLMAKHRVLGALELGSTRCSC